MAQTQDPWITSQTLYHRATQDPRVARVALFSGLTLESFKFTSYKTAVNHRIIKASIITCPLTLSTRQILDFSKLKEFADDNLNLTKMVEKQVENTVGKGYIACYLQFILFPHSFKRLALHTSENLGLFGKGLNPLPYNPYF